MERDRPDDIVRADAVLLAHIKSQAHHTAFVGLAAGLFKPPARTEGTTALCTPAAFACRSFGAIVGHNTDGSDRTLFLLAACHFKGHGGYLNRVVPGCNHALDQLALAFAAAALKPDFYQAHQAFLTVDEDVILARQLGAFDGLVGKGFHLAQV